ncbi:MAG: hypothetical protein C4589_12645 [Peptococcaceae bacterium]|nr:MAG: hypothetical protein C4589_12645 [Peptococcaceae bacterium]
MTRKVTLLLMIPIISFSAGCNALRPPEETAPPQPETPKRFVVVQEEGEMKNIGGLTVLKDNETGKEYLVVTGLNGATTVIGLP